MSNPSSCERREYTSSDCNYSIGLLIRSPSKTKLKTQSAIYLNLNNKLSMSSQVQLFESERSGHSMVHTARQRNMTVGYEPSSNEPSFLIFKLVSTCSIFPFSVSSNYNLAASFKISLSK